MHNYILHVDLVYMRYAICVYNAGLKKITAYICQCMEMWSYKSQLQLLGVIGTVTTASMRSLGEVRDLPRYNP